MNYILAYYQAIKDGSIVVGVWIRLIFEYIVKGLESRSFLFDQKKATRAIRFIESFCHHCEGRNDLIKLELWQKAIVQTIFGIVDEEGVRIFREVMIIIGRKNGKTLFASALIAYCQFCDGEYGAKCFCIAPKLDQTDIVYQAFRQTVEAEPELARLVKPRKTDLYIPSTNSSVKRIAFSAKKSDGFNPSLTICDEIASWQGDAGLKQYEVMKSALGARKQPLIISISTAGYVNDGIYDELMKRATSFLKGNSREKRLLPFLYIIDDPEKWNDINELKKSNPNLGVSVSVDYMLEEIAIAEGSLSKKTEFMVKYCNVKQNSSLAWLDAVDIARNCTGARTLEDFRGCYCVAGIDLSQTTDLTACLIVVEKDGLLYVFSKFFMPEEKFEERQSVDNVPYRIYEKRGFLQASGDNFVDYHDCYKWMTDLIEVYGLYPLMTGYDRYSSQYLIQDMKNYGFKVDDVYQGNNLTPVINEAEGMIRDGRVKFVDNDLMKIHMLNAAIKIDAEQNKKRLIKIGPTNRIDGCAAFLDAMCVRQKWYNEMGDMLQNRGK